MSKYILKTNLKTILKRGHYIYHMYFWFYGLCYDFKIAKRSLRHTVNTDYEGANPAQSISYYYLKELVKTLEYSENDILVDVGCAWGRLIGYLKLKTNIKKFIGVEINKDVAKIAKKAFKNDNRVAIVTGSILDVFPSEGTIYYLFNPFDENVLKAFIEKVEECVQKSIKVLYLHPVCHYVFDERKNWILNKEVKLKPSNMGELTLYEYIYQK